MGRCKSHQSCTVNESEDDHYGHAHTTHSQECIAAAADNVVEEDTH